MKFSGLETEYRGIIIQQALSIRLLRRNFWYMFLVWVLTVSSGIAVFVTWKLPQPNCGSFNNDVKVSGVYGNE